MASKLLQVNSPYSKLSEEMPQHAKLKLPGLTLLKSKLLNVLFFITKG